MKKITSILFSILFIISSLFYLISEFITISLCEASYNGYIYNTISELALPKGMLWHNTPSSFSPLALLMNLALIISGILFFISYTFSIKNYLKKSFRPYGIFLALLVAIGSILVAIFHGGKDYLGIHEISTSFVFIGGNLCIILTMLFLNEKKLIFKTIGIFLGIIGILSSIVIFYTSITNKTQILAILERLAVYPIIIFELMIGIYTLKKALKIKKSPKTKY